MLITLATILILIMYFIVYRVCKLDTDEINKKKIFRIIFVILGIIIGIFIFYLWYLKNTSFVKTWDIACYWKVSLTFDLSSILGTIKNIIRSINMDEYNLLPSYILQPVFNITNKSFNSYVFSIFLTYVVPCILLYHVFITKIYDKVKSESKKIFSIIVPLLATLSFVLLPQIHYPVLSGYLDIVDIIFILICYIIILNYDFKKFNLEKTLILAVCTFLIIILRRYYIFWVIGFYFSIMLTHFLYDVLKERQIKQYLQRLKNITIPGLTTGVLLAISCFLMIIRLMKSDYTFSYSAYKTGGILSQLYSIVKVVGIIPTIMCILGYTFAIMKKNTRKLAIIMTISFATTIVLFNMIQTMGYHHMYLILPMISYGLAMFLLCGINNKYLEKSKLCKAVIISIYVIILILNFIVACGGIRGKYNLFSDPLLIPEESSDMEEIDKTVKYIENLIGETDKTIYIIASSHRYNSETFSNYRLPDLKSTEKYSQTSGVDLTHGFNSSFYYSNYVMTITPIQYHLNPENQRVITILYNAIENQTELSDNYELIYEEENDIIFKIYKKVKELDNDDKQYLLNEFNLYYSDLKELFEYNILK